MAEQRYQAVMAVIGDGSTVSQAAENTGVARQTLRRWLARCEAAGLVLRSTETSSVPRME